MSQSTITQAYLQLSLGDMINPSIFKGYNLPVENVNWNDCQEFIQKSNKSLGFVFRLTTDAEWEFAARDGNSSRGFYNPQRYNVLYREVLHNTIRQSICNNLSRTVGLRLALSPE